MVRSIKTPPQGKPLTRDSQLIKKMQKKSQFFVGRVCGIKQAVTFSTREKLQYNVFFHCSKSLAQNQGWCWEKFFVFMQASHPASPMPTRSFRSNITYCENVPMHHNRIVREKRRWTEALMQGWMPYNTWRHIMARAWNNIQICITKTRNEQTVTHTHREIQPGAHIYCNLLGQTESV